MNMDAQQGNWNPVMGLQQELGNSVLFGMLMLTLVHLPIGSQPWAKLLLHPITSACHALA